MTIKDKILYLLAKDTSYKEKAVISVVSGFTFAFNFVFFGMLFIFLSNRQQLPPVFNEVMQASLLTSFLAWFLITAVLFTLPGKISTIAVCVVMGVITSGYVQGNFLNNMIDLGLLTGDAINWHEYTGVTLLNLVIIIVIFALPSAARYFLPAGVWVRVMIAVCALTAGMQAAALIYQFTQDNGQIQHEYKYYLSRDGIYEVSTSKNIIIAVIDRLDYAYIDAVREEDPVFFDRLDGFTEFTNAAVAYEATFPSATFITTGIAYDFKQSQSEYFNNAWSQSQFISTLMDAGYIMKYHMDGLGYIYGNYNQLSHAENLKYGTMIPAKKSIISNFLTLSAYRHSPIALKPAFWKPALTLEYLTDDYVTYNDPLFMELLIKNGLRAQSGSKNYLYLHLHGSHALYTMNEDGKYTGKTDVVSQTKGCFNILYRYMDEMKRLGVYEDSTIIILGDHGDLYYHIGFFVKPGGSAGVPLQQSDAPVLVTDNLAATILKSEGIDYESFGVPVFDIDPGIPGERVVARWSRTQRNIEFYKITEHISNRNRDNWELTDSFEYSADLVVRLHAEDD